MSRSPRPTSRPCERILVCGAILPGRSEEHDDPLGELRELLRAAGAEPVGRGVVQRREAPDPATLLGRGKVGEVRREIESLSPHAVAVDNDLGPGQIRNLERAWGVRVIDRSEVILDIFARRARTRQARLQVELAQAQYLLPRLRRMWPHLERTEGAVGTRGPGETQLETDRRLLKKRVLDLRRELDEIELRRRRQVGSRADSFTVSLVGYTNAGKSTLLNHLTGARELAADMLFATLDTRTRRWRLPDGRLVLLSDTVGFLRRLPHYLVASFHATLEEALRADLLLHVVDASHPDAAAHLAAVDSVLESLGRAQGARILVFNKFDRVSQPLSLQLLARGSSAEIVHVSALTGIGLDRLGRSVARRLDEGSVRVRVRLGAGGGRERSLLPELGAILAEECAEDGSASLELAVHGSALGRLHRLAGERLSVEVLGPAGLVPARDPAAAGNGRAPRSDEAV